jgi:phosphoribosylformimino-5-aminoimidazole carboxamide ribotide isomerase
MLIPSIDLMGGKIVQLVQGELKKLEFSNFAEWIDRFRGFPLVQLIDLDAAMGRGHNSQLLAEIVQQLPCQVGGGVRSIEHAQQLLRQGARRVIFGSALIRDARPDAAFAASAASALGAASLTFAIDSKAGKVAIRGWREQTTLTAVEMIEALAPYCGAFLYTHIDAEGLLQGTSIPAARAVRAATSNQVIVAGGISTLAEVDELDALGIDAIVGMAIYSGQINLEDALKKVAFKKEGTAKAETARKRSLQA